MRPLTTFLCATLLASSALKLSATENEKWDPKSMRVAAAIRYLQIEGVSHAQVYLYRGDGRLIRQLSQTESGDDYDPIFSSAGDEVVFRRQKGSGAEFWIIQVATGRARELNAAPAWYNAAIKQIVPKFDYPPFVPLPHDPQQQRLADYIKGGDVAYSAPDNSVSILLKDIPSEARPAEDWYPKEVYLRQGQDQSDVLISTLPYFSLEASSTITENAMRQKTRGAESFRLQSTNEVGGIDGLLVCNGSPFLFVEPLRMAFLRQHRGSTDCAGFFALDLNTRRVYEVTPNCGDIIPLSQKPAFFSICNERYLPLGDGKRTVNCSFLDLWSAGLQRIRFSKPKVARYYGGSVFQPEAQPAVTVIRERQLD